MTVFRHKRIITLTAFLIAAICLLPFLNGCVKKTDINGSLVYTKFPSVNIKSNDRSIFVYNGEKETKYTLKEYEYVFSVNEYFSGDFCCECFKENPEERYVVLFKDGRIEDRILIPETVGGKNLKGSKKFFAFENEIFFTANSDLYRIDRQTEKAELIDLGLMSGSFQVITAKSDGTIAYIKSKPNTEDWVLCIYKDGEINEIREAYSVYGWLGSDKLLIEDYSDKIKVLNVSENITEDPNPVFDGINSSLFVSSDREKCAFYTWDDENKSVLNIISLENMSVSEKIKEDEAFSKDIFSEQIVYLGRDYSLRLNGN